MFLLTPHYRDFVDLSNNLDSKNEWIPKVISYRNFLYSKNNEKVNFFTLFFVKIVSRLF
jgi:hypothetical protein